MNDRSASLLQSQFAVLARVGQLLARALDAPQTLREVLRTLRQPDLGAMTPAQVASGMHSKSWG
ncbi:hypothetical protein [Accumulibacter sp.]|jgi:hypothetical protein|uniref:hypothetical protein n=1 Tax=Accumulibacter sp. TaxID=2053492 RepID=UPI001AC6F8B4|nr:hypothetical protein [Accumulibacter sp.]MBN8456046.1 hypothetical protein [Accumulibacter sp.]MBO3709209.1 hypothetical protein [Accumulibacter sp.]